MPTLVDATVVLKVAATPREVVLPPPETIAGAGEVRVPTTGVRPGVPTTKAATPSREAPAAPDRGWRGVERRPWTATAQKTRNGGVER